MQTERRFSTSDKQNKSLVLGTKSDTSGYTAVPKRQISKQPRNWKLYGFKCPKDIPVQSVPKSLPPSQAFRCPRIVGTPARNIVTQSGASSLLFYIGATLFQQLNVWTGLIIHTLALHFTLKKTVKLSLCMTRKYVDEHRYRSNRNGVVIVVSTLQAGWSEAQFPPQAKILLFSKASRPALWGPCNLPFNTYRSSFPWLQRLWREANHSPPSSSEVNNGWSYTSTPPICLHGVGRDNCTFTFKRRAPFILNLDNRLIKWSVSSLGRLPSKEEPLIPIEYEAWSYLDILEKKDNRLVLPGIQPRLLGHPVPSQVTISTEITLQKLN